MPSKSIHVIDARPTVKPVTKLYQEIPVGSVFTGKIGVHDHLWVKSYLGIISLSDPIHSTTAYPVVNYKPVNISITISDAPVTPAPVSTDF